ncbi:MAG TPA: hypothetical protein VNU46_01415 [Gemmatimonadaceae bacterium]|jgi:hypothetical protein|nr:hypothetical protein [Gemmatimonadaceae bacterium]
MSEILVQFDEPQRGTDGRSYIAQVCGRLVADDLWEAWIEFAPTDGRDSVRTGRETEQFTRGDLRYWAAHLTREYLDEALPRALTHTPHVTHPTMALIAMDVLVGEEHMVLETDLLLRPVPVLDPFALYRQSGTYTLRQELRALDARRLQDIIAAYEISALDTDDVLRTFEDALAERIVADVQQRVGSDHLEAASSGAHSH